MCVRCLRHGLGGYNTRGEAWRVELDKEIVGRMSINLLEFLASAITIHQALKHGPKQQKILAYTDNSSALGWLHKASFSKSKPAHDRVARWLAECLMKNDSALYSQHIRGGRNFIADALSRDHHLSDDQLTFAFHTLLPSQTPKNFKLFQPTEEATSFIYSLGRSQTGKQESQQRPSKSKMGRLIDGADS